VTDGTIQRRGAHARIGICQSKATNFEALRELVAAVAPGVPEVVNPARRRTFPSSGMTYDTLEQHWWYIPAAVTRAILERAGFHDRSDLPRIVTRLSSAARRAMLQAFMLAEGDAKGVFCNTDRHVLDAFAILSALEGYATGQEHQRTTATYQRLKKTRHTRASNLHLERLESQPAWCPTTDYGTWVMRQNGRVMITGNTKAKRRVTLSICGLGMLDETEVETIPGAEVVLCEEPQQTTGLTERPAPTRGGTAGTEPAAAAPSRNAAEWTPQQLGAAIRERAGTQTQLRTLADWQTLARTYGVPAPAAAKDMTQDWLLSLYQALCAKDYEERLGVASGEKEVRDILAHALTDRDRRLISSEHYTRLYDVAERRYAELSGPLTAHKHAS
jgi:hypothetical protein